MLKSKPKKKHGSRRYRTQRMYHDVVLKEDGSIDQNRSRWDTVRFSDGKGRHDVPISMTEEFLNGVKRGSTYECVLAKGTMSWAVANPTLLPHDCLYVYVTRTALYIVDAYKNGKPFHSYRYMHGFSQMTETFDTITKAQFKKRFEGQGFILTLKPGRKYRAGESNVGGNGKGGTRTHTYMRGAKARAIAAGLIAPTAAA
jgi:hypothetical protein